MGKLEPVDKISFEAWNEGMVEKYDIEAYYSHSNCAVKVIESERIRWILNLLSPRANEAILEVGCGAGHVLQRVSSGRLYGIDISSKMISLAKRRLMNGAELKKCDAGEIDYPNNFFDKIICTEVLEHTLDPLTVLREIKRVAKTGATVVLSIPNEALINRLKDIFSKMGIFKFLFKNVPESNDWHLHSFSLPALRSMTRGLLEEVEVRPIPNRFFPIRYVGKYKVQK